MTESAGERVEVTQADREAAASAYFAWISGNPVMPATMRDGRSDDHSMIQAFARHRLASQPAPTPSDHIADAGNMMAASDAAGMREAAAKVADAAANGHDWQRHHEAGRGHKRNARDFETMALADRLVASAIRALPLPQVPAVPDHDMYVAGFRDGLIDAVPEGFVLVPREPTEAMVEAWADACPDKPMTEPWGNEECARADWSAMLAAAPQPDDGWRPIETAPKDGTDILAWCVHQNAEFAGSEEERANWQTVVVARWTDHNKGGWMWYGLCGQFTHWRPLPASRSAMREGKAGSSPHQHRRREP